ncbi:33 kDa chaperonin (Heat shock protein 33) (HSP33) [Klebsiella pneumoniae]|uniref:33 kDa chaperonin (Heat shock protein 33) (HSP33) n=1 Tax=Klebsiella pneumoniae TaxID=573 RepID=A0A378A0V2_KLEPN|nr:33 kDa chaperonin (Heat shock protein 33) (HSP33) [Klebsiella pneumoniae]
MLLQVMPAQDAQTADFEHLATLTETIKAEELFTLPANDCCGVCTMKKSHGLRPARAWSSSAPAPANAAPAAEDAAG